MAWGLGYTAAVMSPECPDALSDPGPVVVRVAVLVHARWRLRHAGATRSTHRDHHRRPAVAAHRAHARARSGTAPRTADRAAQAGGRTGHRIRQRRQARARW